MEALRALIKESRIALPDGLPPMAAGVFGYLGYDMVRLMVGWDTYLWRAKAISTMSHS